MKRKHLTKLLSIGCAAAMSAMLLAGCGSSSKTSGGTSSGSAAASVSASAENESASSELSTKEVLTKAAKDGKIGNWGLGNQYELLALLAKYNLSDKYLSQDYSMDQFDNDSITLASAMTYNELGLVKNTYDGGYGYGNKVNVIDMNKEGVAMLEDNIFCTKQFAKENPETVKAFLYASMKGWDYAVKHPEEAAQIVYKAGSSVSQEHQKYMAGEVAKLVTTDMDGKTVTDLGSIQKKAVDQTLSIAKKYVKLEDSSAQKKLKALKDSDVVDDSFMKSIEKSDGSFKPEKKSVSIQLKWLPQAQFMGYYVAESKGYYKDAGLTVKIVSGGGDISETTAVNNGTVDFGVTWLTNLASADAAGMNLVEVSQVFQRSGLDLVYKPENFK
ncbi:MAG TPA: nitrate ABC transporter substrate-binding protein [Lachnospiraceae bacterium]|nr:nitrate ABC transporter substrate-binding protein [Lachnospiraceae bacterium]